MPVLFKNDQWAVDEFGLVSVPPASPSEYLIAAEALLERGGVGGGQLYDWPFQVLEKSWVDEDAFIKAFRRSIEIHAGRYPGRVDHDVLEKSIAAALARKAKTRSGT